MRLEKESGLCVKGSRWPAESLESIDSHGEPLWFAPLERTDWGGAGRAGRPVGGNCYLVHLTRGVLHEASVGALGKMND